MFSGTDSKPSTHKIETDVMFASPHQGDFQKRCSSTSKVANRSKVSMKLIVVLSAILLCMFNFMWNSSEKFPAKKVSPDIAKEDGQQLAMALQALSLLKEDPYDIPDGGHNAAQDFIPQPKMIQKKKMKKKAKGKSKPKGRAAKAKPRPNTVIRKPRPPMVFSTKQAVPIYYVNLDRATDRRQYIEKHLEEHHLQAMRVSAVEDITNVTVALVSPSSLVNPNNKEIACIASHMIAIHKAVNDHSFFPSSPFAIIIEDDVKFEFPVNWNELLYNAPEDFDVLQLMTSNFAQVVLMAEYYDSTVSKAIKIGIKSNFSHPDDTKHSFLWNPRLRGSYLWSTQAYAIQKDKVKNLINALVKRDPSTGHYFVTLKNTPNQVTYCKQIDANSCKLLYPFRLVADTYLYDLLGVGYTLRLPLLNGAQGFNTSIQSQATDHAASVSFSNISSIVEYVRMFSSELLPSDLLIKT